MVATPLASLAFLQALATHTQSVPPRGSRNSLGNRFTSSSSSSSFFFFFFFSCRGSAPSLLPLSFLLLFVAWLSLSPSPLPFGRPMPPPVRTLGFYLFSLIIAGGHVATLYALTLTFPLAESLATHASAVYVHDIRALVQGSGPVSLPSDPSFFFFFPLFLRCLPPSSLLFSRLFSPGTPICEHIITDATKAERERGTAVFERVTWVGEAETHTRF